MRDMNQEEPMRPHNPYSPRPAVSANTPTEAASPAIKPPVTSPEVQALLVRFRQLGANQSRAVKRVGGALGTADTNLAEVCREAAKVACDLTPEQSRELIAAAKGSGLIERGDRDPLRVLVRIGCGPATSATVVSRVVALSRKAVNEGLDLEKTFEEARGFWAAYDRHIPARRSRIGGEGEASVRVLLPAELAHRLNNGGGIAVTIHRDAVSGRCSAKPIELGGAPEHSEAHLISAEPGLAVEPAGSCATAGNNVTAGGPKHISPDDNGSSVNLSEPAVAPERDDRVPTDDTPQEAARVLIQFRRRVTESAEDSDILRRAGGAFNKFPLNGNPRSLWCGPLTPEVRGVMERQQGEIVHPDEPRR
jgi:hypothetical protein